MSSNDIAVVLKQIEKLLEPHTDVVGELICHSDYISTKLKGVEHTIRVKIVDDSNMHASMAHAHVIVESSQIDLKGYLDACVLGIDSKREAALKDAADYWFTAAAGPIFSLLHARPVLNAQHFCGDETWGVEGVHGFVGPLIVRLSSDESLAEKLIKESLFQYSSSLAPPGLVHLAKTTLNVVNGKWSRTIEVDGHQASYCDRAWNTQVVVPKQAVASRFATFHFGNQAEKVKQRQSLDDAIRKYVEIFEAHQDAAKICQALIEAGHSADTVDRVDNFITLAFGRALITDRMPFQPAQTYHRVMPSGELRYDVPLMSEPAFARSLVLSDELARTHLETVKELALWSAEIDAINNLLNAGGKLEDCQGCPFLIPDLGTPSEVYEQAVQSEFASRAQQQSMSAKTKIGKPWWKFW